MEQAHRNDPMDSVGRARLQPGLLALLLGLGLLGQTFGVVVGGLQGLLKGRYGHSIAGRGTKEGSKPASKQARSYDRGWSERTPKK